jgi:hypothetical protein
VRELWEHVYGDPSGVLALFSGLRAGLGGKTLSETRSVYFTYPRETADAEKLCLRWSSEGREVYFCAHLLTARRRIKENAAPLLAPYVDGDGAQVEDGMPIPTAVVRSSPGRQQFYFRLTEPVPADVGERLNRRLALAMGADRSGWDLTQLLRPPGTRNYKYPEATLVRLVELNNLRYDPGELDRMLPALPDETQEAAARRPRKPAGALAAPNLSRLSPRIRDLIRHGNQGRYKSRSEADMAVCTALFGAGYSETEVWAVMTDTTNAISEKFLEKGRYGERYLSLTIGKAIARAAVSPRPRQGRIYARRKGVVSIG